jgi:hypothetical protein
MNNKKYRVVCQLNALERRLRELHGDGSDAASLMGVFQDEATAILAITAAADLRYVRGRLNEIIETHRIGLDAPGQAQQILRSLPGFEPSIAGTRSIARNAVPG